MTTYLNNRDGGKTNEEGHLRFQAKVWSGNIVSGLQAVQRSPLAMGINISVGDAKVDYSTYGYSVWIDSIEAVGITTADPSNPRIDRIVGYVDRSVTPSSTNSNNPGLLKFMSVAGTPAASPSAPSNVTVQAAVGASNPYFNIANVLVGTGVTTISTGNITDTRVFLTVPANSVTNPAIGLAAVKSQNIDFTTSDLHSDTNPGMGGGTRNYIDMGGIKICWGLTSSSTVGAGADVSKIITFPSPFFSGITLINATAYGTAAYATQVVASVSTTPYSTTTCTLGLHNFGAGTSGAMSIFWYVIGI